MLQVLHEREFPKRLARVIDISDAMLDTVVNTDFSIFWNARKESENLVPVLRLLAINRASIALDTRCLQKPQEPAKTPILRRLTALASQGRLVPKVFQRSSREPTGMIKRGQCACRSTRSECEPRRASKKPSLPSVAMTIKPAFISLA